ncbi:MAG TPA: hypothetical protein VGY98_06485 [Verrucomicrobiae bacterium]|nr:hypothetical protein [Verrucomicrobiae bacterium]
MKITQVAILLMRLFGVYLCFDIVIVLTELPALFYNLFATRVEYMKPGYVLVIVMALVRLIVYSVSSIGFLVFARPLAKLFTKDLEE